MDVSIASALAAGQRAAKSRMGAGNGASTVHVWRKTGKMVPDANDYDVPEWVIELSDIPCRFPPAGSGSSGTRTFRTPGGDMQVATRRCDFPAGLEGLRDGDYVEVVAGRLSETVWHVIETTPADHETALRCPVEQVDRPSGFL